MKFQAQNKHEYAIKAIEKFSDPDSFVTQILL